MKKFLMALATATLVASPIVTAQASAAPRDTVVHKSVERDRHGNHVTVTKKVTRDYRGDRRDNGRRWAKGQRFDHRYASHYTVINRPTAYRLNPAPRGYHWVRSGNDAVLVGVTSGIISAVIANAILR